MLKFFSFTGEIEKGGGELVYRETIRAPATMTVFAGGEREARSGARSNNEKRLPEPPIG